jgi:DNA-binding CsgD family transcriptional regulator/tetratricopeptide (TPR) repeat protein
MLLERESALASLTTYAADAERGDGRLVLISAEAGGGKSALLEEFALKLTAARWLWAASEGLFTPRPLGPLYDLAEQLGGELMQLCAARASRDELFRALLRQLIERESVERQLSERDALTVVVFEDLHWADEATIDLVRFLGRRLRGTRVLILATFRDTGAGPRDALQIAVGELSSQQSTKRVALNPLSETAVLRLANGSKLDGKQLYHLTGGNPFFVAEVVAAGVDTVPASARDAVLARVARLSTKARGVLEVAALVGRRAEPELLSRVAPDFTSVSEELSSCDLLTEDDGALVFRHELARLAVEQTVFRGRRPAIHSAVLAALLELGHDEDARLAFHAEAARDHDAVLLYAPRAAEQLSAVASHREAAAQYERSIRFAGKAPIRTRAALYENYAREVSLLDRWEDADAAALRALELWREAGDRNREGGVLSQLGGIAWRLCNGEECLRYTADAVRVLEPLGPSAELAAAYEGAAGDLMIYGRDDEALAIVGRARAMAMQFGATDVLSGALNTEACALFTSSDEWPRILTEALELAVEHGHNGPAGRAYSNFTDLYTIERDFARADRYRSEGLAFCEERDMDVYVACLTGNLVLCSEITGDWDVGMQHGDALLTRMASPINRINALCGTGLIAARRGTGTVWARLDEAADSGARVQEPEWIAKPALARAEAAWIYGNLELARSEIERIVPVLEFVDQFQRGAVAVWFRRLGVAYESHGTISEPHRLMLDGKFDEAAEFWLSLSSPAEAAMALYDGGTEPHLRKALAIFGDLGAKASANRVRARMRELGIRSIPVGARSSTRAHPSGLTRRESEVLELIARGGTNADIAESLFISQKTVDHHVSAILAKLGTSTRVEAAAEAGRLGLVGVSAG